MFVRPVSGSNTSVSGGGVGGVRAAAAASSGNPYAAVSRLLNSPSPPMHQPASRYQHTQLLTLKANNGMASPSARVPQRLPPPHQTPPESALLEPFIRDTGGSGGGRGVTASAVAPSPASRAASSQRPVADNVATPAGPAMHAQTTCGRASAVKGSSSPLAGLSCASGSHMPSAQTVANTSSTGKSTMPYSSIAAKAAATPPIVPNRPLVMPTHKPRPPVSPAAAAADVSPNRSPQLSSIALFPPLGTLPASPRTNSPRRASLTRSSPSAKPSAGPLPPLPPLELAAQTPSSPAASVRPHTRTLPLHVFQREALPPFSCGRDLSQPAAGGAVSTDHVSIPTPVAPSSVLSPPVPSSAPLLMSDVSVPDVPLPLLLSTGEADDEQEAVTLYDERSIQLRDEKHFDLKEQRTASPCIPIDVRCGGHERRIIINEAPNEIPASCSPALPESPLTLHLSHPNSPRGMSRDAVGSPPFDFNAVISEEVCHSMSLSSSQLQRSAVEDWDEWQQENGTSMGGSNSIHSPPTFVQAMSYSPRSTSRVPPSLLPPLDEQEEDARRRAALHEQAQSNMARMLQLQHSHADHKHIASILAQETGSSPHFGLHTAYTSVEEELDIDAPAEEQDFELLDA